MSLILFRKTLWKHKVQPRNSIKLIFKKSREQITLELLIKVDYQI